MAPWAHACWWWRTPRRSAPPCSPGSPRPATTRPAAPDGRALEQDLAAFRPDLVVLDVMLPGRDGFALLEVVRRHSDAGVVMLTARDARRRPAARAARRRRRLRGQAVRAGRAGGAGDGGAAPAGRAPRPRSRSATCVVDAAAGTVLRGGAADRAHRHRAAAAGLPRRAARPRGQQGADPHRGCGATPTTTPTWSRCTSRRCGASSASRGWCTPCAGSATCCGPTAPDDGGRRPAVPRPGPRAAHGVAAPPGHRAEPGRAGRGAAGGRRADRRRVRRPEPRRPARAARPCAPTLAGAAGRAGADRRARWPRRVEAPGIRAVVWSPPDGRRFVPRADGGRAPGGGRTRRPAAGDDQVLRRALADGSQLTLVADGDAGDAAPSSGCGARCSLLEPRGARRGRRRHAAHHPASRWRRWTR